MTHTSRVWSFKGLFLFLIILNILSVGRTYTKHQTHAQSSYSHKRPVSIALSARGPSRLHTEHRRWKYKQQNYDGYSTKKWQGNANWKRSVDVLNSCKLPQSNLLFYDNYKAFNNTGRKRKEESKVKTSLIWTEPSVGTYTGNCWSCCWHLQSSDHTKTRKKQNPAPHMLLRFPVTGTISKHVSDICAALFRR